ncbi:uncharacterized protein [Nicotiana sylvestris]|uniref:uncharacterized protein n=1 Tax=Nicotiana sylvestris TaxID=4096 RepID=UPI00388C863B
MTVTQYETRFINFARHALVILPIEKERVRRFIDGLIQPIRLQMAKEAGSEITFQEAANVARRVEMVFPYGGGHGSDKRPRHSGRFSGTFSGGRDSYGRGHPPRPFQSALQVSHGASVGHGPPMQYSDQQSFSIAPTPISAPPLQSFQGRQPHQPRACFTYGNSSHIARYCPRSLSSSPHQGSRAMVQAPDVLQTTQPARSGGRGTRGGGRGPRGGAQAARSGGQPATGCPREVVQGGGAHPRCYALPAMPETEASNVVITGINGGLQWIESFSSL